MRRNNRHHAVPQLVILTALLAAASHANEQEGWTSLFDGKTPAGWLIGGEAVPQANVQDGAINPHKAGGGRKLHVMYTKEKFSDFVLRCEFKVTKGCNSGVFIRTADPNDPVQTGLEIQV